MFALLEEKLAGTASGLGKSFNQLYQIRRERMNVIQDTVERYLREQNSSLDIRDYLVMIWSAGFGGAGLLNSSFYQRYLGDRGSLKYALVLQILDLPKLYVVAPALPAPPDEPPPPKEPISFEPKLLKPLTPPKV